MSKLFAKDNHWYKDLSNIDGDILLRVGKALKYYDTWSRTLPTMYLLKS
jgi:hypothetical protein